MAKNKIILQTLNVQNFATFINETVHFTNGFNAIVGETGSGKSLILDALQLTFGARADKKMVRKDAEFASIETTFTCEDEKTREYFDQLGYPFDEEIIIKRVIYPTGKSKSFLNYQSCPLAVLNQVTRKYIDLVGQFENQKLLSENYQLKLLDDFSETNDTYELYLEKYNELTKLQNQLTELHGQRDQYNERKDFIKFQIKELESLAPSLEREEELKKLKSDILNEENNKKTLEEINYLLSESDHSVQTLLSRIEKLSDSLSMNESLGDNLSKIISDVNDISYDLSKLESDDEHEISIDDVLNELDDYQRLKRKFNTDTEGLESVYQGYLAELESINNIDKDINKTIELIQSYSDDCYKMATTLHQKREKAASKLSKALTEKVHQLRMSGAVISLEVDKLDSLTSSGLTKLKFMAQTNPGEGFYAIKDIASGGELSRILLALRQVLSQTGSISVFLFDEIDTGIGGETALTIGKALKSVSTNSQVIAITHLPQIANASNFIIVVDKEQQAKRTFSVVKHIREDDRATFIESMQVL
jgi:DNA repair protein RecN (Recombination protein N)